MAEHLSGIYWARAEENLQAARRNFEAGSFHAVARDAYYAVFQASMSLLLRLGLNPKTHKGARMLFGREVVRRRGLVPPSLEEAYQMLYRLREVADYPRTPVAIRREEAERILKEAGAFLREVGEALGEPRPRRGKVLR